MMQLLLDRGAGPNKTDKNGETTLLWDLKIDHKDLVQLLLERGADLNKADNNRRRRLQQSELSLAAAAGRPIGPKIS